MKSFNAHVLFGEAFSKLATAQEELNRPEEDVVTFLVCKNAQFAVESFLTGYLLKNGTEPAHHATIKELYEQCLEINPGFSRVNLTEFDCRSHQTQERSCSETGKVNKCLHNAVELEHFLKAERLLE